MNTFGVRVTPGSPGPQYICLTIGVWAGIRFLQSEPKTHDWPFPLRLLQHGGAVEELVGEKRRTATAMGGPDRGCPPASWPGHQPRAAPQCSAQATQSQETRPHAHSSSFLEGRIGGADLRGGFEGRIGGADWRGGCIVSGSPRDP
eukprot:gene17479-biopygen9872